MGRPKKEIAAVKSSPKTENNLIIDSGKEVAEIATINAACLRAGVGIDDYVRVIKEALSATKTTLDRYGEEHVEEDHVVRLRGALMGLELEGYIKNKAAAVGGSTYNTVIYKWDPVTTVVQNGK